MRTTLKGDCFWLWNDSKEAGKNQSSKFRERLKIATLAYFNKWGHYPTHCEVHPNALDGSEPEKGKGIIIETSQDRLPHDILIGKKVENVIN